MKGRLVALIFGVLLAAGSASAQVVVGIGPPPRHPRVVVPVRPSAAYVWTPRFYRSNGHHYNWVPDRYVIPPRSHVRWVPGYWAPRRGGYVRAGGYWR